jgi:hypothetical protein
VQINPNSDILLFLRNLDFFSVFFLDFLAKIGYLF